MRYTKVEEWIPADGLILEDDALATVKSNGNRLVTAGPGAGKTELLAQRAGYLLETNSCRSPRKILAISFKKDAAENLAARVKMRVHEDLHHRFVSLTYDAFAKLLLDRFRHGLPELYRPHKNYVIEISTFPESILAAFELHLPGCTQGFSKWDKKAKRARLFDSLSVPTYPLKESPLAISTLREILNGAGQSVVNFSIISRLVHYLLRSNPTIIRYLQQTYTHVFLDEFQDTTKRQYDVLKAIFQESNTIITAVGDSKQRIMLWAGAMAEVFTAFQDDFGALKIPLLKNYRSAPRLVELQNILAATLLGSKVTCVPGLEREADEGVATFYFFDHYEQEAIHLAETIYELINTQGVSPREIVLLYRALPAIYGDKIIDELNARGISARVENEFQDLMTEPVVRFILGLLQGACEVHNKEARRSIIYEYCKFNNTHGDHALLLEEKQVLNRLKKLKGCVDKAKGWPVVETELKSIINEVSFEIFSANYPHYSEPTYFSKCMQTCLDHLRDAFAISANINEALKLFLGQDSIPLMTIHKSKGLEFEVVFFIGFEDETFWSYQKQPLEDIRSFFVALSRAKEHVNFSFSKRRLNNFDKIDTRYIDHITPIFAALAKSNLVSEENRRSSEG